MFIDSAQISVKAGDGGRGIVSFRKEKFVDRGGPDGGDGGRGGNVIAVGDPNMDGLANYRYSKEVHAEDGQAGGKQRRHGANGEDVLFKLPLGTEIWEGDTLIADIVQAGTPVLLAKGGGGGFGNAHFVSSRRQAPRVAEIGEKGDSRQLRLELKLIADVGLIGLPNAGKSTFLSVVTSARPKIADYPFTTLAPNLGVADIDGHSLLIADIPGLIEGASEGKGLGDQFLRHVERTAVLLHLIDATEPEPTKAYDTIRAELGAYKIDLSDRPQLVVLTKADAVATPRMDKLQKLLKKHAGTEVFTISSVAHVGLNELLRAVHKAVAKARKEAAKETSDDEGVPVLGLPTNEIPWTVEQRGKNFVVRGTKIERFAARTDFDNPAGVRRLKVIMRKMGIMHALERRGIQPGNRITIGSQSIDY